MDSTLVSGGKWTVLIYELLIGANVPKAMEPLQVIRSINNGPCAIRTMLGWTERATERRREVSVNRVSVFNLDELWQQQFKTDFP